MCVLKKLKCLITNICLSAYVPSSKKEKYHKNSFALLFNFCHQKKSSFYNLKYPLLQLLQTIYEKVTQRNRSTSFVL